MRILTFPAWSTEPRVTTPPLDKGYCGIAIGPDSAEGLALCEGFPLQAGRVLPIRERKYTIEHVRPTNPRMLVADVDTHDPSLDCIQTLSVIVFEDPSEMGAHVMRPNLNFSATKLLVEGAGIPQLALSVPFVGRRQCAVTFYSPNLVGNFGFLVRGVRYQYSARKVVKYNGATAAAQALDENGTFSIEIGGMDNAELWDVLEIYLMSATATFDIDADTVGEIGAY